ncbi:hypothetical protein K435DRAFT_966885 [Dendrothele bispora CBS 962.96]|uniref:DUF8040 domain-containing protein n=1 Tax=Dendrothele bispora (strain CBS 962.96) TaxID=1314807 RepID=A0A4V6T5D4_DENBC|nr:hypothetical protein K435DRAFT_966885 [Dendrothele bispora CBS 962.96]
MRSCQLPNKSPRELYTIKILRACSATDGAYTPTFRLSLDLDGRRPEADGHTYVTFTSSNLIVRLINSLCSSMVTTTPARHASTSKTSSKAHARRKAAILGTALSVAAVAMVVGQSETPVPKHTSSFTGEAWVRELLGGHEDRIREQLGVSKLVFRRLRRDLC